MPPPVRQLSANDGRSLVALTTDWTGDMLLEKWRQRYGKMDKEPRLRSRDLRLDDHAAPVPGVAPPVDESFSLEAVDQAGHGGGGEAGMAGDFAGGERRITEGPFTPRTEFPAAFAVLRVRSRDEAVEIGTRFAALLGDGEMDIRPVTEPWHLGFGEPPKDDPTTRFMIVWKADARSESGTLPSLQLRASLGKLIADGRIHPARIEELVTQTQGEMERRIQKLGEEAAQEADVHGLHERVIHLLGRLHFRTSYSQNVLRHSIEVAHLTGMMAEQLGLDGKLGRRCGFFHDIGKAADHEMEGGHPAIGADLLKRYGEGVEVVHAAAGHHDDIRPEYIYTVLTAAADACSASRPGSRRETLGGTAGSRC